jgi:nitrate reductase NapE component
MSANHTWKFFRAGGFDQVKLETGADLMALDQLDQKLWVALACPTSGLEFDKDTLVLIDTDKDGRIRAPELIAAVKWAGGLLKNPDDLLKGAPTLRLAAVNDSTPEGKLIAAFARQVLSKTDSAEITIDEAAAAAQTFAAKPFNGDGIVPADSASDDATKVVINDIIACVGADTDASGKPGVGQAKVDQFFAEAGAYAEWWKKAEGDASILPLGLATPAAAAAARAVKAKVDDYFARCRLAAFDARAISALNREEKEFLALAAKDLTITSAEIAGLPLSRVEAGKSLALTQGLNPAWAEAVAKLHTDVIKPLLGDKTVLTEADWAAVVAKLAPYDTWSTGKTGATVEKITLERVREILAGKAKETLTALIAKDKGEEGHAQAIVGLNRLVHYHRDLNQLCHNFVSFRDFYGRNAKAIFQAGTLYLDQRSCDLCLTVEDTGRHAAMAGLAGTYLAYCDCYRKGSGEKMHIVAAFTDGDSDNLMVGRNGIFYDRKGRDWDATINKIIDNPISIRQAFFAPYKKLVRMIEEQVAKRAAAADAAADAQLAAAAQAAASGQPVKPVEPPKQKIDTGTLAAIGLVLTTLLGALGGIFGHILGLVWWQIPLAFLALLVAISAPSVVMAYLKLRRRNLGPILDANGWAVNAKAKMNVPFGGSLTSVAALPPGSQRDLVDPFAEKKSPWPKFIILIIVLVILLRVAYVGLDSMGFIYDWTNGRLGTEKPAKAEKAVPAPAPAAAVKPAEATK